MEQHPLSVLSREAIKHCSGLWTYDVSQIRDRLYRYNTMPATAAWRARFGSTPIVRNALGLEGCTEIASCLCREWIDVSPRYGWFLWTRAGIDEDRKSAYKIFISPHPEDTISAFERAVPLFDTLPVAAFKIGRDVHGLLRPDKFVIYFEDQESLQSSAPIIVNELIGLRGQGVPFTNGLGTDRLVSWGCDPPNAPPHLSWRYWMTDQVAQAIVATRAKRCNCDDFESAVFDALGQSDVDFVGWRPPEAWMHHA